MSFFPISFSSATTSLDTAASRFSEILGGRREEEKKGRRGEENKKEGGKGKKGSSERGRGRERKERDGEKEKKREKERSRKRNSKREMCETVGPVDMSSADSQTNRSMSHSLVFEGYFCLSV